MLHIYKDILLFHSMFTPYAMQTQTQEREQNRLNPIYKTTISCKIKVP